jgi:hypothetical protein
MEKLVDLVNFALINYYLQTKTKGGKLWIRSKLKN